MQKILASTIGFVLLVCLTSYGYGEKESDIESQKAIAALKRLEKNRTSVIRDLEKARQIELRNGDKIEANKIRALIETLQHTKGLEDTSISINTSKMPADQKTSVIDGQWISWTNTRIRIRDGGIFDTKGKRIGDCVLSLNNGKHSSTRVTLSAPSQRWHDPDMHLSSSCDMMVGKSGTVTVWWRKLH